MWHRDDESFDDKLAATAAPAPSAGERRNRELRQQVSERGGGHDLVYIGQERTGERKLISTTRAKANAVPNLGLERLRVRDKGWFAVLFACCEDEHEDGSYCGFRKTTRAIHAFFFDEPPAENVDPFGFKIEEWDKVEMEKARATRRRWQCLRLVFLFLVVAAIVAGSVFIDEVASEQKVLAMQQQAGFEARVRAKVDRLTPSKPPTPPNQPPTATPSPPVELEPPTLPPPIYQFASIEDAREALRAGGANKLDFNKLARGGGAKSEEGAKSVKSPGTKTFLSFIFSVYFVKCSVYLFVTVTQPPGGRSGWPPPHPPPPPSIARFLTSFTLKFAHRPSCRKR